MEAFKYSIEMESNELNSTSSDQFSDCFFKPNNWDNSDRFESALSSIVSSPVAASNSGAGDGIMIRELIGRLGTICNSGETSANNSCYATPLNSPPKLNLSMPNLQASMAAPPRILAPFSGDPGFAERAAKNSLLGGGKYGYKAAGAAGPGSRGVRSLVNPAAAENGGEFGDSREGSSVSDQIPINAKKRKSSQRAKAKEVPSLKHEVAKGREENEELDGKAKKSKKETCSEQTKAAAEAPKDYIHVRARRGQATDSHSLAERVRREKISERMKFLQDLVPGCNKVTGKAVMLDEIINYVQSLQRQVEFLSMKLATVNPRMDFNLEALLSKDIFQSRGSLPHGIYPLDSLSLPSLPFGYQHQNIHQPQQSPQLHNIINDHNRYQVNPQAMTRTSTMHLATVDGFAESAQQVSTFFEDDLQSMVQMGFGPIQQQIFHGSVASGQMKIEP